MRNSWVSGAVVAALALLPVAASAQQTAWLHVRVEEAHKASKVSVNLPMTVVEAALKAAPQMVEEHGKIHLGDHHGMKLADFRRIWKQLAAVGDAEFVTVDSDDEHVRIGRKGDIVQIFVDDSSSAPAEKQPAEKPAAKGKAEAEPKGKAEAEHHRHHAGQVRVEVPVSLVDALLSGEGDEVNIQAAIAELQKRRGDIVRVTEADNNVRIWIDEQNTQPAAAR